MAKEDNTNTEENITLDVMPGADPVPEEEAGQDFKVDMNFETQSDVCLKDYMIMIEYKTAVLLAASK